MESEFKAAGARNVKADRSMLGDYNGDVSSPKEANGWLFSQVGVTSRNASKTSGGTTGLESAGVSDESGAAYMRRWATIAGLDEKE